MKNVLIACTLLALIFIPVASDTQTLQSRAYTDQQVMCLANAIYYEARGESHIGQKAVAHVVLNRVEQGVFPGSVCGVVLQRDRTRCQFSWVCTRSKTVRAIPDGQYHELAHRVLHQETDDPTNGALFFHSRDIRNPFNRRRTAVIGNHIFYK